ncbi:Kinesin-like protein kip2 [Oleoguttula sp. CCFEE 5521]
MSIGLPEESTLEVALQEKDKELAELRAKLDDQVRMVQALRSATRKRETLEGRRSSFAATERAVLNSPHQRSQHATDQRSRPQRLPYSALLPNPSSASANSATQSHSTTKPLSPVAILSNGTGASPTKKFPGFNLAESKSLVVTSRRRSVDEMTALLDQMIADKVESGHAIRSERGSLRVKRDTVMERGSVVKGETLHEDGEEDEGSVD